MLSLKLITRPGYVFITFLVVLPFITATDSERDANSTTTVELRCVDSPHRNLTAETEASEVEENAEYLSRTCGIVPPAKKKRILNGVAINRTHAWPWQVSLYVKIFIEKNLFTTYGCGGAVISSRWILTAAHCFTEHSQSLKECFMQPQSWEVRAGEEQKDNGTAQRREVSSIVLHPGFQSSKTDHEPSKKENDIALVRLRTPLHFGFEVQPLCLPPPSPPSQFTIQTFDNEKCVVVGFQTTEGNSIGHEFYKIEVPIMPHESCSSHFGSKVTSKMFCAGHENAIYDACQGDSGRPLVCSGTHRHGNKAADQWIATGIVSWGEACFPPKLFRKPGVYTRVESYVSWIVQHVFES